MHVLTNILDLPYFPMFRTLMSASLPYFMMFFDQYGLAALRVFGTAQI